MSRLSMLLFIIMSVKIALIVLVAHCLKRCTDNIYERFASSWIIVYMFQIGMMLIMSILGMLTAASLAVSNCALLCSLIIYTHYYLPLHFYKPHARAGLSLYIYVFIITTTCVVFSILAYRSLYFFDTTWDGLTYELPRIFMYASYRSLLVHQSTKMLNIFCNEWNGELNGLFYTILTGNDQAVSFGNVEIWLFGVLAFAWITYRFGLSYRWGLFCGLVISLLPMSLALSMTVKGDLLAFISLPLLVCWFIKVAESKDDYLAMAMLPMCAGLAAGSKISVLPVCLMILACYAFLLIYRSKDYRNRHYCAIAVGGVGCAIGVSRYVINLIVYHNPFARVEIVKYDSQYIGDTIKGLYINILEGMGHPIIDLYINVNSESLALDKGFGLLGICLLAFPVIWCYQSSKRKCGGRDTLMSHSVFSLVCIMLCINMIYLSYVSPWYEWSFRYYAPFLSIFLIYVIVYMSNNRSSTIRQLMVVYLVAGSILQFNELLKIQEVWPISFSTAYIYNQQERKLAFHPYFYTDYGLNRLPGVVFGGVNVLILNDYDSAIEPFFGPNHSNRVELCASGEELISKAKTGKFDLIVVTMPEQQPVSENEIRSLGYSKYLSNKWWTVFTKEGTEYVSGLLFTNLNVLRLDSENSSGFDVTEGPYPQWGITRPVKWMISPTAQVRVFARKNEQKLQFKFRVKSPVIPQHIRILLDGEKIMDKTFSVQNQWVEWRSECFTPVAGENSLTFETERYDTSPRSVSG